MLCQIEQSAEDSRNGVGKRYFEQVIYESGGEVVKEPAEDVHAVQSNVERSTYDRSGCLKQKNENRKHNRFMDGVREQEIVRDKAARPNRWGYAHPNSPDIDKER